MDRARAKDLMLGAAGMLLVLVLVAALLWWALTDAVDDARGGSAPGVDTGQLWGLEPPADLGDDEAWFAELELGSWTMVAAGSELRDVHAVGQDVVTNGDGLVAARVTVEATVPFAVVSDELGEDVAVGAGPDGQATVVRSVVVEDRELLVTATGTVEVVAGSLLLEPRSIDVGGVDTFSEELAAIVRRLVTIEHDIEGLPEGLVLQEVAVQGDGFRATLRGEDVELVTGSTS